MVARQQHAAAARAVRGQQRVQRGGAGDVERVERLVQHPQRRAPSPAPAGPAPRGGAGPATGCARACARARPGPGARARRAGGRARVTPMHAREEGQRLGGGQVVLQRVGVGDVDELGGEALVAPRRARRPTGSGRAPGAARPATRRSRLVLPRPLPPRSHSSSPARQRSRAGPRTARGRRAGRPRPPAAATAAAATTGRRGGRAGLRGSGHRDVGAEPGARQYRSRARHERPRATHEQACPRDHGAERACKRLQRGHRVGGALDRHEQVVVVHAGDHVAGDAGVAERAGERPR